MKKENLANLFLLNLGVMAAYWVISWLTWLLFKSGGVLPMPLWPAAGLAVAVVYRFGWRVLPGLYLGSVMANMMPLGADWQLATIIGLMNALGPWITISLLRAATKNRAPFQSLHDLAFFLILPVVLHPVLTATGGIGGRLLLGQIQMADFGAAWQGWWLAHAAGTILFSPLLLVWFFPEISKPSPNRQKFLLVSTTTVLFALLIFFFIDAYLTGLPYLLIIPMAWVAVRYSMFQSMALFTLIILMGMGGIVVNPMHQPGDLFIITPFRMMAVSYSMVLLVLSIMRNTHKEVEEALRQSEARFRSLSESAPVGIAISDHQQKIIFMNKKFTELTGYTLEDVPTVGAWMLLAYPDEAYRIPLQEQWGLAIEKSIRTRTEITPFECRVRCKDDTCRCLEIGAVATEQLIFATFVDITRRLENEEALKEGEAKYRQITENMSDMIWTADLDFRLTYVSPSVEKVFGLSEEAYFRQPMEERFPPESIKLIQTIIAIQKQKLAAGTVKKDDSWVAEMEAFKKDGSLFWIQSQSAFIFDDQGKPAGVLGTTSDITERKAAQELLRRSEERIRFALETSQLGAWDMDLVDHTTYHSLQHDQIFGYQELLPEWTFEIFMTHVHPDDYAGVDEKFNTALQQQKDWNLECRVIRADGQVRWIWLAGRHTPDARGLPRRMAGIVQDITERKQAEQALKESETRYRAFFEQNPDGVVILDPSNGNFIDFNDQTCRQLGYTREELSRMGVAEIEVLETSADVRAHIQSILAAGEGEFETRHRTKQGDVRDVHVIARVINTGQQKIYHCIWRDITERKRAEEALNQEKLFTDAIFTSVPGLLYLYSEDGHLLRWNKRHEEVTGYSAEELDHFFLLDWYKDEPEDIERITRGVQRALQEGFATEEGHLITKNGTKILFNFTAARLELGGRTYFAGIGIDITERRETEEAIQTAQAKLEQLLVEAELSRRTLLSLVEDQKVAEEQIRQLNQELEQRVKERTAQLEMANHELESFSYSVSHDLRAPLRALDGFSSALLEDYSGKLDEQGQHYLARIQEASRRMGQLINDLLDLSRVTRSDFVRRKINLTGLVRQIAADLQSQAPQRQVDFEIAANLTTEGDANLIKIAMENLMHNAFKFTGHCDRAVIQVGMMEQAGEKVYFVRDNGAGFNMEHAGKLFTPFQRLHGMQEFPGTGIGLSIVHRIIARHGGRIWPESEIGRGTTFFFTLGEK